MENIITTAEYEPYIYLVLAVGAWLFKLFQKKIKKDTEGTFLPEVEDLFGNPIINEEPVEEEHYFKHAVRKVDEENLDSLIEKHNDNIEEIVSELKEDKPKPVYVSLVKKESFGIKPKKSAREHKVFNTTGLKNAFILKEVLDTKHF